MAHCILQTTMGALRTVSCEKRWVYDTLNLGYNGRIDTYCIVHTLMSSIYMTYCIVHTLMSSIYMTYCIVYTLMSSIYMTYCIVSLAYSRDGLHKHVRLIILQ